MALMDEFKEQRAGIKNATLKKKLKYFWDYYKWHVIVPICVIILIASLIHHFVTQKDIAFNAILLNASAISEDNTHPRQFADYAGINTDKSELLFDTSVQIHGDAADEASYTSMEKLMIYTATGDLDVMVTDADSFREYAYNENFHDLRDILTEEQIAKYEPYFYYVDLKIVEEINTAVNNLDSSYVPVYPDPAKPEEMDTPIPIGLYVTSGGDLLENYNFWGTDVVLGVYSNTKHTDTALKYIDFLLEEVG